MNATLAAILIPLMISSSVMPYARFPGLSEKAAGASGTSRGHDDVVLTSCVAFRDRFILLLIAAAVLSAVVLPHLIADPARLMVRTMV